MGLMVEKITALSSMKKYPQQIFYSGNLSLLQKRKVSIVGTRKPSKYTKEFTQKLAATLLKYDVCVVSGGAMGVDAIAHSGATSFNTISVLPCGIDKKYPAVNKNLLIDIETNGLLLSQFDLGFEARPWSFVARNEIVVALGEVLVVCEADSNSGSMRSVEFALEMGKEIYVLPQRLGESKGTNELLLSGKAKAIYNLEEFAAKFSDIRNIASKIADPFIEFCKTSPSYDEVLAKFPQRVFEAELNGEIEVVNARVFIR